MTWASPFASAFCCLSLREPPGPSQVQPAQEAAASTAQLGKQLASLGTRPRLTPHTLRASGGVKTSGLHVFLTMFLYQQKPFKT